MRDVRLALMVTSHIGGVRPGTDEGAIYVS
jgi:hypothetical protein